nr:immunoglobulin heavy chain junction region [Macaca mulatta]MOV86658.1 immunoglobulin heavy chain junction region [Macaca mulatta]MOV86887.1 immunoglobulin heavy chain junction region [Macaca mulatta]MOV86925.1 immunoglobulin heavy chain junction region [Macaca mulatta]MOV87197.1 immunoglobulin heavy chain junction region [Macaca mulatta]
CARRGAINYFLDAFYFW